MNTLLADGRAVQFSANAVSVARLDEVCMLRVHSGRVWVTQEGLAEDFWLAAGDDMIALPGCLIVLEATRDSEVRMTPLSVAMLAHRPSWSAQLAGMWRQWWRKPLRAGC